MKTRTWNRIGETALGWLAIAVLGLAFWDMLWVRGEQALTFPIAALAAACWAIYCWVR